MNMGSIGNENNTNESYFIKKKSNGGWGNHWMLAYICTLPDRHEATEGEGRGGGLQAESQYFQKGSEV